MKPDFEAPSALNDAYEAGYNAGLERAAEIADAYDGDGLDSTSYGDQLGNASKTMDDIAAAIRAEKETDHG